MPQIVDHNGQPINTGLLKTTIATPTTTGVRQIIASASHGLDPELLGHMLRQAVNGDASAYLRLAEDMEEKYLHYGSELSTRKRALVGLELYVEPAGDDAVSQRAAELVEQALAPIKENMFDILDAIGKGFSVHEIDWETSAKQWMPVGLSYLQPYWLQIRREEPETLYLRSDSNIYGEALAPYKFITHKVKAKSGVLIRGGLARMACWAFLFSNYAIKDWVTFAEAYGQPLRVANSLQQLQAGTAAAEVDKVLDEAITAGKITPASRGFYQAMCSTDMKAFKDFVKSAPVVVQPGTETTTRAANSKHDNQQAGDNPSQLHR